MILQGVGHPISYLGVWNVNDPQNKGGGGVMVSGPPLDLTTSFGGDFSKFNFFRNPSVTPGMGLGDHLVSHIGLPHCHVMVE